MSEIISKELLSEVLKDKCSFSSFKICGKIIVCSGKYGDHMLAINIHELAYKCKEWAYKKGFVVLSGYHENNINSFYVNCHGWTSDKINKEFILQVEDTEPEGIFKACQWILDNKDK